MAVHASSAGQTPLCRVGWLFLILAVSVLTLGVVAVMFGMLMTLAGLMA
jgi:hypothetical protein